MTEEWNDVEIVEGHIEDLDEIYPIFQRDFPADERKSYNHIKMLMINKNYKLIMAKRKGFGDIIGYAFIYLMDDPKIIWLDYIAIDVEIRNAGYGTLLLNKIIEMYGNSSLGMFIEVEMADSQDETYKAEQMRRIKFYERLGAKRLDMQYRLPTKSNGLPMYLYFKPNNIHYLLSKTIKVTIISVFNSIHSDASNRASIMKMFLNSIHDEYFYSKKSKNE